MLARNMRLLSETLRTTSSHSPRENTTTTLVDDMSFTMPEDDSNERQTDARRDNGDNTGTVLTLPAFEYTWFTPFEVLSRFFGRGPNPTLIPPDDQQTRREADEIDNPALLAEVDDLVYTTYDSPHLPSDRASPIVRFPFNFSRAQAIAFGEPPMQRCYSVPSLTSVDETIPSIAAFASLPRSLSQPSLLGPVPRRLSLPLPILQEEHLIPILEEEAAASNSTISSHTSLPPPYLYSPRHVLATDRLLSTLDLSSQDRHVHAFPPNESGLRDTRPVRSAPPTPLPSPDMIFSSPGFPAPGDCNTDDEDLVTSSSDSSPSIDQAPRWPGSARYDWIPWAYAAVPDSEGTTDGTGLLGGEERAVTGAAEAGEEPGAVVPSSVPTVLSEAPGPASHEQVPRPSGTAPGSMADDSIPISPHRPGGFHVHSFFPAALPVWADLSDSGSADDDDDNDYSIDRILESMTLREMADILDISSGSFSSDDDDDGCASYTEFGPRPGRTPADPAPLVGSMAEEDPMPLRMPSSPGGDADRVMRAEANRMCVRRVAADLREAMRLSVFPWVVDFPDEIGEEARDL